MRVTWEYCHTHGVTTYVEDAELLGCGCEIHPSGRPTKEAR